MAYGAKAAGADPLAHTVHIWPSQELIDRSWEWPESWHAAYEEAASQIGRAVGVCVLGGLPVIEQPIALELPSGWVIFSVRVSGTSIYISITAFERPDGPDSPGPGGGRHQPRAADGLGLGLRGTGKGFGLVTFYGYLPPLPAGYCSPSGTIGRALAHGGKIMRRAGNGAGPDVASLTKPAMSRSDKQNHAVLTISRARVERCGRTAKLVCGELSFSTNMSGNRCIMLPQMKGPIVPQVERSSSDRSWCQYLH